MHILRHFKYHPERIHLIPFVYSKDLHVTSIGQTCLTMAEDLVDTDGTPKEGHYIEFGIPVKNR